MGKTYDVAIAIVGAGIAGLATAYYLSRQRPGRTIAIVDERRPMSYTSPQSGNNYRNWWPHPIMARFVDSSIDLLEQIAADSNNSIQMKRRGYALATRKLDINDFIDSLAVNSGHPRLGQLRIHENAAAGSYVPVQSDDWRSAPDGVDILSGHALVQEHFSSFTPEIANVIHIRRAGEIDGQQLGDYMLANAKHAGSRLVRARVIAIERHGRYCLSLAGHPKLDTLKADIIVNAAGPFVDDVAQMQGLRTNVVNVYQQKFAFDDRRRIVPRNLPFSIDLDEQFLNWTGEEKSLLSEDDALAWLIDAMPGGVHCRPEGGENSRWVKLGWAYNSLPSTPCEDLGKETRHDPQFPEIVLRRASSLLGGLSAYVDTHPERWMHYGGYYTMTDENWPLIGPTSADDSYIVGALSGFGTMAACAAGSLCARWIDAANLPDYATALSPYRYEDSKLMAALRNADNKGIL